MEVAAANSCSSPGTGIVERLVTHELVAGEHIDASIDAHTPDHRPPVG
jgi:hypothetical protein